ncbi:general odorant-binding protein 57e-like [Arctopsyche grandis]|uniref:general odorant-binding protein 57e-like n=1 Tax=Arctopsyche grandis TaxID=121162 RepID=UPI00406D9B56
MKIYEVILILVCFGVLKTTQANVHDMIEHNVLAKMECIDQYDVEEDILEKVMNGKIDNVNKDIKCFLKCELMNEGYMKEDGRFDVEKMAEEWSFEISHVYAGLRFCGISKFDDMCEKAFKLFTCMDDLFDYSTSEEN